MFGHFRDFFPKKRQLKSASAGQTDAEGREPLLAATAPEIPPGTEGAGAPEAAFLPESYAETRPAAADGTPAEAKPLTPAQRTGMKGEEAAAAFLTEKGHRVLERNWRAGRDEIDLITRDGAALVFVEVRTRADGALVGGYHSIDARKKAALRRVCGAYLKGCHPRPLTYRLDVVQISMGKGGQMQIHHYAGIALFN